MEGLSSPAKRHLFAMMIPQNHLVVTMVREMVVIPRQGAFGLVDGSALNALPLNGLERAMLYLNVPGIQDPAVN